MKLLQTCILFLLLAQLTGYQIVAASEEDNLLTRAAVTSVSNMKGFKGDSYSWHKGSTQYFDNPRIDDPTLQGMLMKAIANTLDKKGYEFRKNSWESDLFIGYVAALESSLSSKEIAEIYGINPGLPELSNDLNKYEKGTLIIHVFDTKLGQLLWRGALQAEVQFDTEPNARWERVQNSINILLRDFPNVDAK